MADATFALIVKDPGGQPIEGAGVILSIGKEGFTNRDGYLPFQVPVGWLSYSVHKAGYKDFFSQAIEITGNRDEPVTLEPKSGGRFSVQGTQILRGGKPWFGKGASFFIGYERFLRGEDLRPQLDQLKGWGANCVDVWASYVNVATWEGRPPFHIGLIPGGLNRIEEFHALLAEYEMAAIWVAFADAQHPAFKKGTAWEVNFWNAFNAALDPIDNVATIILNNEHTDHPPLNEVNRHAFLAPPRHLGACSSFTEMRTEEFPKTPKWDVAALHHGRKWPKILKDACTADHPFQVDLGSAIPVWLDEPINIEESAAGKPEQSPEILEQMARTARGSACGIVFHSEDGKNARLYGGYTAERAERFFAALK